MSIPEDLHSLLRFGAAAKNMSTRRYAERLINRWLASPRVLNADSADVATGVFRTRIKVDLHADRKKELGIHALSTTLLGEIRPSGVWARCVLRQECPGRSELLEE